MSLSILKDVLAAEYKGPKASLSEAQVIKSIVEIGQKGVIGRSRLGSSLDLGQGEIRTLIKRLRESGLITIEANGCSLTDKGRRELSKINKAFPWRSSVSGSGLGIGKFCWAVVVRGHSKKLKRGIEQRDAAIKAGAAGSLTLLYSSDRFLIPVEGTDCEKATGTTEPWNMLRNSNPEEGDVVIISGAEDSLTAEYGGWSAALTLS